MKTQALPRLVAVISLLLVMTTGVQNSVAQDSTIQATPVDAETCYFSPEDPIHVELEVGQEANVSFSPTCEPQVEIINSGATGQPSTTGYAFVPGTSIRRGWKVGSSLSNVCRASSRTHDVVHISLTHSEIRAKWYYNGSINTGRSYADSSTIETHLNDGWHTTYGPWFSWYSPLSNPNGAEGGTEFAWFGGQYRHTHQTIVWVYGSGWCSANFDTYGTLAMAFHVHYALYY